MSTIKVFKVNDYEWWAGASLDDIRPAYKEHTGIDPDSDEGFDNPYELSDEQLQKKTIHFDEGEQPDQCSFKEHLNELIAKDQTFPCYFAGTEY